MTREEAIRLLTNLKGYTHITLYEWLDVEKEALDMAIEALSYSKPLQTTLNGDLVSRADAIEAVASADETDGTVKVFTGRQVNGILSALPSAEANSEDLIIKGAKGIQDGLYNIKDGKLSKYYAKGGIVQAYEIVQSAEVQGEWIEHIGGISHELYYFCDQCYGEVDTNNYDFCPHCGARMKGGDDE